MRATKKMGKANRGFTLVELLGCDRHHWRHGGLLLPAVQAAREGCTAYELQQQLKQIGLGIHNYHAAYDQLPNAWDGNAIA